PPGSPPKPPERGRPDRPRRRRPSGRTLALAGVLVALLTVVGVLATSRGVGQNATGTTPTSAVGDRVDTRGGALNALTLGPVSTWDPQRIGSRPAMAFAGRMFVRTLTAYAPSTDPSG
ncbi:MAG: hypothetical protein ACRCZP_12765, partial [Phycicoccus sp.]